MHKPCIVIGSYKVPAAVKLNIAAIRFHCGNVPILIHDDCSDSNTVDVLKDICKGDPLVELYLNKSRLGRIEGEFSALRVGLGWARENKYDFLFKLSQRWMIDRPGWLEWYCNLLFLAHAVTIVRWQGKGVSTAYIGFNVQQWHEKKMLDKLHDVGDPRIFELQVASLLIGMGERVLDKLPSAATSEIINRNSSKFRRLAAKIGASFEEFPCFTRSCEPC